jgi:8-oxo-dGTP pyrophosphatase MutT (NUDIX family)
MAWVLGFGFDPYGRVALIQKRSTAHVHAGCWNALGGKIEPGEEPVDAMRREFLEESGVDIEQSKWLQIGHIVGKWGDVTMFTCTDYTVQHVTTKTDEQVCLFTPWELRNNRSYIKCGDNVLPLIDLILLQDRPKIILEYSREQ